jgi:hypothetical protein
LRQFVPPINVKTERAVNVLVGLGFSILLLVQAIGGRYDWLLLSGFGTLIFGIYSARDLPERFDHLLERLAARGALVMPKEQLTVFELEIEKRIIEYWAPISGVAISFAIFISFLYSFSFHELVSNRSLILFLEVLGGYISGCYLGRMACYGMLGPALGRTKAILHLSPGHVDGAAGLKPVGDFYLFQSGVVAIPAIFLASWSILFMFPYFHTMYPTWQKPYIGLLVLAIGFEIFSFFVPLIWFHREMSRQKRRLCLDADRLSGEISELQGKLANELDAGEANVVKQAIEKKAARYEAIEALPVWPIDQKITRIFSISNLLLLIPFVGEYTGLSKTFTDLIQHSLQSFGGHQ